MKNFITILICAITLASCTSSPKKRAENAIEDYITKELKDPSSYEKIEFQRIDSTNNVNHLILEALQKQVNNKNRKIRDSIQNQINFVKKNYVMCVYGKLKYKAKDESGNLKTYNRTFYLDRGITKVITFKDN